MLVVVIIKILMATPAPNICVAPAPNQNAVNMNVTFTKVLMVKLSSQSIAISNCLSKL